MEMKRGLLCKKLFSMLMLRQIVVECLMATFIRVNVRNNQINGKAGFTKVV